MGRPEGGRRARRADGPPRTELVVHGTAFAIVNAFLWLQDIVAGGGLEYAYWPTIPWGIGLIAHALAYDSAWNEPRSQPRV